MLPTLIIDGHTVVQRVQTRTRRVQRGALTVNAIAAAASCHCVGISVSHRASNQCQNTKSCFNHHIGASTVAAGRQGFGFYTPAVL